jgi:hypothetical protein
MTDEQERQVAVPKAKRTKTSKKTKEPVREQSTISFPYQDMESAVSVARAMLQGGGVALSRDQLAGVMNQSAGSGAFVTKLATARIFGLVVSNNGKFELTNIGFEVLDSDVNRQKAARAAAFLNVPLFKKVYEEFRGRQLPPRPHGLEQAFVRFGVASKQKTNARLAFDKSASQAGFFPNGQDRLIEPILSGGGRPQDRARQSDEVEEDTVSASEPLYGASSRTEGLHPFVQGLLDTLPEPQTNWTVEGRAKWLQAAANIFDLIYKGSGEITIKSRSETEPQ